MKEDKDRLFQFPFYPADFLVSTMLMKPDQRGAYITLLCHAWIEDGLEDNEETLCAMSGLKPARLKEVLKRFARDSDGKLRQPRMERVRDEIKVLRDKRAKAGRKGAEAKWQSHSKATDLPMAKRCDLMASKTKQNKAKQSPPISPRDFETKTLSTADRIGMEKSLVLISEEIKTILNKAGRNAMQEVISWGSPDDPERLKGLRAREREIKSQLMGFTPRKRENPIHQGMQELASELADEMRL